ncbi:MAG: acyclic terpene utilization AtuA family protein [Candidatus Neomarinimicrobiota bacterium]
MVRIGNGQGFWGDSVDAPVELVTGGPLDYLTLDYLAEVTMSIMQRQKRRDPQRGYAADFVELLRRVLPFCRDKGVRIIANAGGVNPAACLAACRDVVSELGLEGLRFGLVSGDDILPRLPDLMAQGEELANLDTGEPLRTVQDQVVSANVYLDTFAIAEALGQGADVVITGRCTDPGLVLGPAIHEFGWGPEDWDLLAAGTVAGHILECGAQCTGGIFTHWQEVPDLAHVGYPIAEVSPDGGVVITKHEGTGGMVTVDTVAEQLVYELGDPRQYITPDVVVDFTSIRLEQAGPDRVRVSGVQGSPATDTFKVSINTATGWKASGQLTISGPDAEAKAQRVADIVWARLRSAGCDFDETITETIGAASPQGARQGEQDPAANTAFHNVGSLVLVLGVKDTDRAKVERFGKELAPVITSGPPGITGFAGGRPKPNEVIAFWPALISKSAVTARVAVEEV